MADATFSDEYSGMLGMLAILVSYFDSSFDEVLARRYRSGSKLRDLVAFEHVTRHVSDTEFKRAFRMSRYAFHKLLRK